jgi:hypothetical protein
MLRSLKGFRKEKGADVASGYIFPPYSSTGVLISP